MFSPVPRIPSYILVLALLWMQAVRLARSGYFNVEGDAGTISIEEAYLDAVLNEEMMDDVDEDAVDGSEDGEDEYEGPRRSKRLLNSSNISNGGSSAVSGKNALNRKKDL